MLPRSIAGFNAVQVPCIQPEQLALADHVAAEELPFTGGVARSPIARYILETAVRLSDVNVRTHSLIIEASAAVKPLDSI